MAEKLYYSMGEVTEMLDVAPSLIRYWGTQFDALRPHRNKKGNRMFTPEDLEVLKMIYHLVKEQGMTIAGAKKALRARRATSSVSRELSREVALLEQLQQIRALLVEVRDGLGADVVEEAEEEAAAVVESAAEVAVEPAVEVVAEPAPIVEEVVVEPAVETVAETAPIVEEEVVEPAVEEVASEAAPAAEVAPKAKRAKRQATTAEGAKPKRTKRQKESLNPSVEERPLFPFYEQTLF